MKLTSYTVLKMNVLNFFGLLNAVDADKERRNLLQRFSAILCSTVLLLPSVSLNLKIIIIHL